MVIQERRVQKDVYRRAFELLATTEDETRHWRIAQALFEHMLFFFDAPTQGLAICYAKVGSDAGDGIHYLHEVSLYGTPPWPTTAQQLLYWGSTHLGGLAAGFQRVQLWDAHDGQQRWPLDVDVLAQSSCAHPVMRGKYFAGVLLVSSTQPGFFSHLPTRQALHEYALLFALAVPDHDFVPADRLKLCVMPDLDWQREEMKRMYIPRLLEMVRQQGLSYKQAETQLRCTMALEFAQAAQGHRQDQEQSVVRIFK
ncbi:hypothetical protein [Dictyobacter arantiisoli]|uniref:GAF domain-containing protein n=1 Tax=Dictyobacter arantiisoli TaxID=2014874 RepID=A0A5A5TF37_9CHLR|nr:hypothetical protein [Dictyobacter arantiisoli]GCF09848.1 hypothetical protein KDI_34120 [Dictyobacter arantiisoli]